MNSNPRDSARIDPIDHRIKKISFRKFVEDRRHSRINFSLFSHQNLTFKHSLDMKIDLEAKESKRFKDLDV